jgi:hypothetical protein
VTLHLSITVVDHYYLNYGTCTSLTIIMVFSDSPAVRRRPDGWREVAYPLTKLLFQPAPRPIVYIVPVTDILGRLALVPYGEHKTILNDWLLLRDTIPKESVIIRTVPEAEVSSTTSIPGPCFGLRTIPAILAYQLAERTREWSAQNSMDYVLKFSTNIVIHYVHILCFHHFLCALLLQIVHT